MHDIDWDDARLLLELSRARTLGEAGRRLGVDGSTVSRRLDGLEHALGRPLFERDRAGARPNEAAQALIPIAEEMEHAMARLKGAADAFESQVEGEVRIACPPDAAEAIIVPRLPELMRAHPGLRIYLDADERPVDLARRDADLAVRVSRPTRGELSSARVGTVRFVPMAAAARVAEWGRIRDWAALPWLGYGDLLSKSPSGTWLEKQPDLAPTFRSDNLRVLGAIAAEGAGAVLLPEPSAALFGLEPIDATRKLLSDLPEIPLYVIGPGRARSVPRLRVVWDFLAEAFASTTGDGRRGLSRAQNDKRNVIQRER